MEERHLLYRIAEGCRIAASIRGRFVDRRDCQAANYVKRVNRVSYGGLRLLVECWRIAVIRDPDALLDGSLGQP